ncbi:retrovirus-related pol polyprotein from transposon TNT 1-94 [Tanacetum coccineum]|uniref:Retrovirus-related pol polyprotein from transposon TNT 1-94 n=1 Tax=Tanacetum coccineum TaxID=301880 RepID=A0ABQ5FUJ5_9ASTR
MRENTKEENVKQEMDEIGTINIKLEHIVAELFSKNERLHKEIEHLKKIYKDQFDSIKKTHALSKEHRDSLIVQLNSKSMENANLKGQIQEKVFVTTALQNELSKLKGKNVLDNAATTIAPGMFKLDLDPLVHRLKSSTSASRSQPTSNKKNDRISQTPSSNMKNKVEVVQIALWYLDSGCSNHMTGNRSQLMNFVSKFLGTVRFGNDQIAKIMSYGDYQLGNVTISRVYYVEGLGHNLFSVGQFCSRDTNLYTTSLDDMLKTSPICLLSKALKTKSYHRLSHLNFVKRKKSSHKPKVEDTNQEKLYLLHIDLCGPMRIEKINGKRYILVIVDHYSRFTWVKFLRSKDEALEAIIKCIKNIQVRLNATVHNVRTNNGTEFLNQNLREFYECVGITHQTFVVRTPQQNGVVERRSRTLLEAARTMLIFSKAPLFLWAKAINTDPNPVPQKHFNPPTRNDWDHFFQPMFDEYFNRPSSVVSLVPEVVAQRTINIAATPSSTTIDRDAPSLKLIGKWANDHPLANVIGNPSRIVSTRKQLETDAMWCYFDAFLTSIEPKNFKEAMLESS